jgi:peptidoglycan hydrolase-like protein with peptidoglycan-binding domain
MSRPARTVLRRVLATLTGAALAATLVAALPTTPDAVAPTAATTARKDNVVTPGNITGYGFDQCRTPEQWKMDRWLQSSPFWAVGVYMSGDSRACRDQPNLTPQWVSTQLANGWRILPITLGPQASCQPRFPRYGDDPTIISKPGKDNRYGKARKQGSAEAAKSVTAAQALGIAAGSTLWYDLEGFELKNTRCRESALAFLSGWSWQIRKLGYVSGVYSSAGSGIKMLDDARHNGRKDIELPDQIWVARWDGRADTDTEPQYLRADGWRPHARVKQYQGGHNETWGGVTINIDRDFLDVGTGSVAVPETHCGGVKIAYGIYPTIRPATASATPPENKVKVLQCLLHEQGRYDGKVNGIYNARTQKAVQAWQGEHGFAVSTTWNKHHWMSLLVAGSQPVLKFGSASPAVRRVQRALNAVSDRSVPVRATGVFDKQTTEALEGYQRRVGLDPNGVVGDTTWAALARGQRKP